MAINGDWDFSVWTRRRGPYPGSTFSLQAIIDAFGWRTVFQIMAGVVPVLCLSGPTYSPNLQNSDPESPPEEAKSKGCHIDVTVWKEPKFVAVAVS